MDWLGPIDYADNRNDIEGAGDNMKPTNEKWFWFGFIPSLSLMLLLEGILFYFANLAVVEKNDWFLGIMIYAMLIFILLITTVFFPKFIE